MNKKGTISDNQQNIHQNINVCVQEFPQNPSFRNLNMYKHTCRCIITHVHSHTHTVLPTLFDSYILLLTAPVDRTSRNKSTHETFLKHAGSHAGQAERPAD